MLELPAIAIEPVAEIGPVDEVLRRLNRYDWIAFTSRNAVRAVFTRLSELGIALPKRVRVAAVGPSTRDELAARGTAVQCMPEEATGVALAAAMAAQGIVGQQILAPVGDRARPDLRLGLERAGAHVDTVIVYRTVMPAAADREALDPLRDGQIDDVTVAGPSAIRHLVTMLGSDAACLARVRLICIGPTTAEAVRELGFAPSVVAERHTLEGLVDALSTNRGEA